jgi:hypothetical protein
MPPYSFEITGVDGKVRGVFQKQALKTYLEAWTELRPYRTRVLDTKVGKWWQGVGVLRIEWIVVCVGATAEEKAHKHPDSF